MKKILLLMLLASGLGLNAQTQTFNTRLNFKNVPQNTSNYQLLSINNEGLVQWLDKATIGSGAVNPLSALVKRGDEGPFEPDGTAYNFVQEYLGTHELLYYADTSDDYRGLWYYSTGDSSWHRSAEIPTLNQVLNAGNYSPKTIKIGNQSINTSFANSYIGYNDNDNEIGSQLWVNENGIYYKGNADLDNNLSYGSGALRNNTTGTYNAAFGSGDSPSEGALNANTSGTSNTAFGSGTLMKNTTGSNSTAVGSYALGNTTTVADLTAVGAFALNANTSGDENTAVGAHTLQNNTSGASNTAVGNSAYYANTTGSYSTMIGANAGTANGNSFNTAIGSYALWKGTGQKNTFLGAFSGGQRRAGNNNTAVGNYALVGNNGGDCPTCTGESNIALGFQAGRDVSTGNANILIQNATNSTVTTGNYNIEINPRNGSGVTTGSGNTIIGGFNGSIPATTTDNVIIGNGNGDIRVKFDSAGQMNIVSSPSIDNTQTSVLSRKTDGSIVTVQNAVRPYKVYTAILNQSAAAAPVATVLENTIGSVTWSRTDEGVYTATASGSFISGKTVGFMAPTSDDGTVVYSGLVGRNDDNTMQLTVTNGVGPADGVTINALIEIRVYN